MKEQKVVGKWGDLILDMVIEVEECIKLYVDKVRFRAVCMSWNSIPRKLPNLQVKQAPWLFHRFDSRNHPSHALFNPLEEQDYFLDIPELPYGTLPKGSSHGWIAALDFKGDDNTCLKIDTCLVNPLTRSRIELPLLFHYDIQEPHPYYYERQEEYFNCVDKMVMSASPLTDKCMVFIVFRGGALGYCHLRDDRWSSLPDLRTAKDIMFYKGKIHVLLDECELVVVDNIKPTKFTKIASKISGLTECSCKFPLVQSLEGELILVILYFDECQEEDCFDSTCVGELIGCQRFKHDSINLRWDLVTSMGNEVMFLGCNYPISISCNDYPGFKGNRIYFSETLCYFHRKIITGILNWDDFTVEPLKSFKRDSSFQRPPVWFTAGPV